MRIIITIIICCGFALCNDLNNEPGISDTLKPRHSQRTIIAAEFTGGFLGGIIGGAALGYGFVVVSGGKIEFHEALTIKPMLAFLLGITLGYPSGSAFGAYLAGSGSKQEGKILPTFIGALAGVPVAAGLIIVLNKVEGAGEILLLIPALAAPPIGAVIGYNLSRPKPARHQSFYHYLNPPTLGLRTEKSIEGETITYLDFKLINAKF